MTPQTTTFKMTTVESMPYLKKCIFISFTEEQHFDVQACNVYGTVLQYIYIDSKQEELKSVLAGMQQS